MGGVTRVEDSHASKTHNTPNPPPHGVTMRQDEGTRRRITASIAFVVYKRQVDIQTLLKHLTNYPVLDSFSEPSTMSEWYCHGGVSLAPGYSAPGSLCHIDPVVEVRQTPRQLPVS